MAREGGRAKESKEGEREGWERGGKGQAGRERLREVK